jgi:hypothetical protein
VALNSQTIAFGYGPQSSNEKARSITTTPGVHRAGLGVFNQSLGKQRYSGIPLSSSNHVTES